MKLFFTVRPIYTCNFSCDILLLMDVNEWMYYECSDEGTYTQNIKRQFFSMSRICDEKCSEPKIFLAYLSKLLCSLSFIL